MLKSLKSTNKNNELILEKNMKINPKGMFFSQFPTCLSIVLVNANKHQHPHRKVFLNRSCNYPRWDVRFDEFPAINIPSGAWEYAESEGASEWESKYDNDSNISMAFRCTHQTIATVIFYQTSENAQSNEVIIVSHLCLFHALHPPRSHHFWVRVRI